MLKYRSEIDGLRALAVIPVILFHAGFNAFSGGFVGVDVFFVISGYLITTILLNELEAGNFSIVRFYERRARRILPALFFIMFLCLPFAWFWLLPQDMKSFSQSLVAVSVFASNILFWRTSGYFDTATELKPLIHTWSLSVEEQYYVLFPLFLLFAWRLGKRRIAGLLAIVAVISLACAQWGAFNKPAATFYLLPTRAWELLIGALIAFYYTEHNIKKHKHWQAEAGSALGFALIAYSIFYFSKQTPFPSLYALAPTIGAALIIVFATHKTLVGKLLGSKPFVAIGLISYSAYLWHQPMLAFARHRSLDEPSSWLMAALAIASIPLAYLTWRFVERPFRNKHHFSRKQVFAFSTLCSAIFIAIGLVGHYNNGAYSRFSNTSLYNDLTHRLRGNYGLNEACEKKFINSPLCRTSETPEILVWGDSYAMHLTQGILSSNPDVKLVQATVSQCAPILGVAGATSIHGADSCIEGNDLILDMLKKNRSIKYVVLGSPSFYQGASNLLKRDGSITNDDKFAAKRFVETLDKITEAGAKPIVFSPPPRNGSDIGQCLLKAKMLNENTELCDFDRAKAKDTTKGVNDLLAYLSGKHSVVWLETAICDDKKCKAEMDNAIIYRDSGHLSYEGSIHLGKKMNFYQLITGQATPKPATQ